MTSSTNRRFQWYNEKLTIQTKIKQKISFQNTWKVKMIGIRAEQLQRGAEPTKLDESIPLILEK
jgi:hypothetical protein